MTTANQTYRQAANSPAGRETRDAAKSAADTARNIGDDVSDFASDAARKAGDFATDVSRRAGKEFDRARGAAGDVWDEVHDATVRNPHLSLAIAMGIGFLFAAFLMGRR
jgi:ElaB/YqjD/DUF883 family membrane-anchored ribosome-binding protein